MKRTFLRLTLLSTLIVGIPSIIVAATASAGQSASGASAAAGSAGLPGPATFAPGTRIPDQSKGQVLASMARDHAIKTVHGNGKRTLYLFSDPDCSYCKKLERTLAQIDNVTIHTFLYPLEALHPQAAEHARGIWCANDRNTAWKAWMIDNVQPVADSSCAAPLAQNRALGLALGLRGTPTLFNASGRMMAGAVSAQSIETLLAD